jgi:hypothetical protein
MAVSMRSENGRNGLCVTREFPSKDQDKHIKRSNQVSATLGMPLPLPKESNFSKNIKLVLPPLAFKKKLVHKS